jgi:hypothetical protein
MYVLVHMYWAVPKTSGIGSILIDLIKKRGGDSTISGLNKERNEDCLWSGLNTGG